LVRANHVGGGAVPGELLRPEIRGLTAFSVPILGEHMAGQRWITIAIAIGFLAVIWMKGVGVVIEAQDLCMMMRGVEKQNSVMTTSCMLGNFRSHPQTRNEFLRLLGN
jgi:GTP cyclohydrolase I